MTGEVTLRGMILPVGGIKEKLLAAHRAGIRTVILPERNEKDVLADLPLRVRQDFKLHYVSKMDQVLEHAFAVSVLNQESWTADVAAKL
jgi:ATP-dependent Lon protease